jgi:F0F1-type ATP synthase epsilon subunit
MLFLLATPEYNNVQSNATKVRVHLRTGIAEIFDQHQDLMGKVENNIVEVETNFENKFEKFVFILQDAVFIVSNQGLDMNAETEEKKTSIYIYAKKVLEVNSKTSVEEITNEYESKKLELETELEKATDKDNQVSNSKILLLQEDTEFLKKSLSIIKGLKN